MASALPFDLEPLPASFGAVVTGLKLTDLDDTDFLAQLEAVDRFTAQMTAYPGRSFGQLYHRFGKGNALVSTLSFR